MKNVTSNSPTIITHHRIDHRGLELGLHLGELLEVRGHAPQHRHERAGRFARAHHVDIQVGKIRGCRVIASESARPSVTSCFNSRLTSAGMPFVCKCVMLVSRQVSGMPELSKFCQFAW